MGHSSKVAGPGNADAFSSTAEGKEILDYP
jgi:hypothetical protein